ncbi:MAG TPA: hypothetical protein VFD00_10840, partial [Thermoclostridium sp.]|nr:hypothetical protein [Thermoclostridium sp.]
NERPVAFDHSLKASHNLRRCVRFSAFAAKETNHPKHAPGMGKLHSSNVFLILHSYILKYQCSEL